MALAEIDRTVSRHSFGSPTEALSFTAARIGKVIEESVYFWPLRAWASKVVANADRRNYPAQMKALYDAILDHWSYVRDPYGVELLASTPKALWDVVLNHGGKNRGVGDCDDVTALCGACIRCLGFDSLIRTVAVKSENLPDHVHIVAVLPKGLLSMDPVVEPERVGFGYWPRGNRDWIWTTKGVLVWQSNSPQEQSELIEKRALKGD